MGKAAAAVPGVILRGRTKIKADHEMRAVPGSQAENCGITHDGTAQQGPKLASGASLTPCAR